MKKALSLFIAILTLVSVCAFTSCNNEQKDGVLYDTPYRIKNASVTWASEQEKTLICDGHEETDIIKSLCLKNQSVYFCFYTDGTVVWNEDDTEKTYYYEIIDKDIYVYRDEEKTRDEYFLTMTGSSVILKHYFDSDYESYAEILFETLHHYLILEKEYAITDFKINYASEEEKTEILDGETEEEYKQSNINFLSPLIFKADGSTTIGNAKNTFFYTQDEDTIKLYMDPANTMFLCSATISKNKLTVAKYQLAGYESTLSFTYTLQ